MNKLLKKIFSNKQNGVKQKAEQPANQENKPVFRSLDDNIAELNRLFDRCSDVRMREFTFGRDRTRALLANIDGLSDKTLVSQNVIKSLFEQSFYIDEEQSMSFNGIKGRLLSISEVEVTGDFNQAVDKMLAGDPILFIDGFGKAFIIGAKSWEHRSIEEPQTEPVIRGPRDGFSETLRINTTLIRRRIRTPLLKCELIQVGRLTKTDVCIMYIDGLASEKLLAEVRRRIGRIDIDGILASGYIEEFIEDYPFTIFPQVNTTERPDKAAANILEGCILIIVDNTPMSLSVPVTFPMLLQASEDYYNRSSFSSFIRILRLIAVNITLLLPSFYVAIVTFHQEMLPTPLLMSIVAQREWVPFPAFVEALIMEATFEILREAGVRLPRPVGQAVSIVGALVIGQAAVAAGIVSSFMVIVVSLTAVASMAIPTIAASNALRILRFVVMFSAATLGLFGVMATLMAILIHLCSLRSFGIPYLTPFAPLKPADLKDTFVRVPWWAMVTRPGMTGFKDLKRQRAGQMPYPPRHGGVGGGQGESNPDGVKK